MSRLKGIQDAGGPLRVHRAHARRCALPAVRPKAMFRHDLLQVHVIPHVEVRRVQQRLRPRIEIDGDTVEALGIHPELERVDHRRLPGSGGAKEVQVTGHGRAEYEVESDEGSRRETVTRERRGERAIGLKGARCWDGTIQSASGCVQASMMWPTASSS